MANKPVLITTEHRGVFVAQNLIEHREGDRVVKCEGTRMVIYWSAETGGVFGLTENGPGKGSRLGVEASMPMTLHKVTAVAEMTEKAAESCKGWVNER